MKEKFKKLSDNNNPEYIQLGKSLYPRELFENKKIKQYIENNHIIHSVNVNQYTVDNMISFVFHPSKYIVTLDKIINSLKQFDISTRNRYLIKSTINHKNLFFHSNDSITQESLCGARVDLGYDSDMSSVSIFENDNIRNTYFRRSTH